MGNGNLACGRFRFSLVIWVCVAALAGCSPQKSGKVEEPPAFERLPGHALPSFSDDAEFKDLRTAIDRSLAYLGRVEPHREYPLGDQSVTAGELRSTLTLFLSLWDRGRLDSESIARFFDVFWARGGEPGQDPLVTGYYEPILDGCSGEDNGCTPLYGVPSDLLTVDLTAFGSGQFPVERLVGRLDGNRVVPYYSRAEIEGEGKILGSTSPIAWVRDPVEAFFLHVQGSGIVQTADGKRVRVGYAASNGRPYSSIGKLLVDRGEMSLEEVSLQSIRRYLQSHPETKREIMWHNQSYVFFRRIDEGPLGSLNVVLTEGRSIATDARYHPKGALAFLETERPLVDDRGCITGWIPLHRWVLNQDTGGAIKGVGRVDLFFGTGKEAGAAAGFMRRPGRLYFLVKKKG